MPYPVYQYFHNPNHGGYRNLSKLNGIVLHYTFGENAGDKAIILEGEGRPISVHFFVADDDDASATPQDKAGIWQTLPLNVTGWSVGTAINGWSNAETISIEVGNRGNENPTPVQLKKVDQIIKLIDATLGRKLPIKSHEEIALPYGRKAGDPGANFPMDNYRKYRQSAPPTSGIVVVTGERPKVEFIKDARLRPQPSFLSIPGKMMKVGYLAYVMAYKADGGWRKVRHGDDIGWVQARVLKEV